MTKTRFLFFCCTLVSLTGLTQASNHWQINGKFTSHEEAPEIILLKAFSFPAEVFTTIAQIQVDSKGQFKWSAPFHSANLYQVNIRKQQFRLAVDTIETISVTLMREGKQWKPKIKGSSGTTKMYQFPVKLREREAFYFGDLKPKMEKAMAEEDQTALAAIQEQLGQLFPKFVADLTAMLKDLGSSTAIYGALEYIDPNKGQAMIEQTILRLQAEKPQLAVTQALVERLAKMKGIPIGALAPTFAGKGLDGTPVQLSDYKGKYLYIDFWASWCLACRAENPTLVKLYQAHHSNQFEMIGIGIKDKEAAWKAAIAKDQLPWAQINDQDNSIASAYFIMSLPQNVLLDTEGKILYRNISSEKLGQILADLLGKE